MKHQNKNLSLIAGTALALLVAVFGIGKVQAADPAPQAGDRMIFDSTPLLSNPSINTNADLQPYFASVSSKIDVVHNENSNNTSAFRIQWPYYGGGTCKDDSANIQYYIPGPGPKSVYFQWVQHMGKTSTGGGIGNLNAFQILDPGCGQANASRKEWLTGRSDPSTGSVIYNDPNDPNSTRIDYIWAGNGTGGAAPQITLAQSSISASAWNPVSHINEDITQTLYLQAESAPGAGDGVVKLWINGVLYIDKENASTGVDGFGEFHFPTVMNSPAEDMTEYIWGVKVWQPSAANLNPNYSPTSCIASGTNVWMGCYYSDQNLQNLVMIHNELNPNLHFTYENSPDSNLVIKKNFFSAKWVGNFNFNAGNYTFNLGVDDGAKLYIDGNLVLNKWIDEAYTSYTYSQNMTAGNHVLEVDYYNGYNTGQIDFTTSPALAAGVVTTPADTIAPTVSITSPASSTTLSGSSVTVSASAADNVGVVGVQFKVDGTNYGAEQTTTPYQVALDTTKLSNGTHTITATARDAAGNVGNSSPVTVTVSNTTTTPSTTGAITPATNECATAQSSWIWCDDFEQNRLSSYFEYTNQSAFSRTAGVGENGSFAMKATYTPGSSDAGNLKLAFGKTPSSYMKPADSGTAQYRDVYWREYVMNQPGWTGGGADKLSRAIVFGNSNWAEAAVGHVWSGGSSPAYNYLMIDPVSGVSADSTLKTTSYNDFANFSWLGGKQGTTPLFSSTGIGQWYCVEAHMKLNDVGQSNGVMEMWVNNNLEAQDTSLNFVGNYNAYGINSVFFENYWNNTSPITESRYIDNIVVATQRIGCGSQATPVSTPPPAVTPPVVTPPVITPPVTTPPVVTPPTTVGGGATSAPVTPTTPSTFYATGTLINDHGTIYLIRAGYKIGFTNAPAFLSMGYKFADVVNGDASNIPSSGYNISSSSQEHPWGTWILYNHTVYYSTQAGMVGVPSLSILQNNGGDLSKVLPANAADINLIQNSHIPVMATGDARILH